MSANRIRLRRNHHRIALALVLVVMQAFQNIAPPANNKFIASALDVFVSILRVAFAGRVEEHAFRLKNGEVGKVIQVDPIAANVFHAVMGNHEQIERR